MGRNGVLLRNEETRVAQAGAREERVQVGCMDDCSSPQQLRGNVEMAQVLRRKWVSCCRLCDNRN